MRDLHRRLSMALPLVFACSNGWAQTSVQTPEIVVTGGVDAIALGAISSSDTASLLSDIDSAQAGGPSGLPMIHGLGDAGAARR
jgi:hypothetical protein